MTTQFGAMKTLQTIKRPEAPLPVPLCSPLTSAVVPRERGAREQWKAPVVSADGPQLRLCSLALSL